MVSTQQLWTISHVSLNHCNNAAISSNNEWLCTITLVIPSRQSCNSCSSRSNCTHHPRIMPTSTQQQQTPWYPCWNNTLLKQHLAETTPYWNNTLLKHTLLRQHLTETTPGWNNTYWNNTLLNNILLEQRPAETAPCWNNTLPKH
jgi:hypothetical protein